MTRIWISIIVVLVGAKLNAEMEHQTVRESTTVQPKPLGRRGVRMADTVWGGTGLRSGLMGMLTEAARSLLGHRDRGRLDGH
jgi:hypothetical protein